MSYNVKVKRYIREDQNALKLGWYLLRTGDAFIGVLSVLAGILCAITIIGIPMSAVFFNSANSSFKFAGGQRKVACPNCTKPNHVKAGEQQSFTCRKCNEHVTIEWVDWRRNDEKSAVN